MPEEILRVQSRRAARQRRVQVAQHVVAAVILINLGLEHGARSVLAICEIVAGALLIASVVRERVRRGHHGGVAWVELAGAVMVFIEAIDRTRGRHHLSHIILSFVQPVVLLLFAIFDAQIASARYLKADDEGFEVRLRLLFRRRIRWKDVRGFRIAKNTIEIETDRGIRKIRLRDVVDRDAALAWAAAQFQQRSVAQ
jgi:hypothetical protein